VSALASQKRSRAQSFGDNQTITTNVPLEALGNLDTLSDRIQADPIRTVAMNKLNVYKEDASQTAARIVREATTED
jgi:hypothetical protein